MVEDIRLAGYGVDILYCIRESLAASMATHEKTVQRGVCILAASSVGNPTPELPKSYEICSA